MIIYSNKGCVTELDKRNLLWLKHIDCIAQVASHGCVRLQTYVLSQGETWADQVFILHPMHTGSNHKSILFSSSDSYFAVLLQSSDFSPQQEALMKKQTGTLEEIKTVTHQVHTLTKVKKNSARVTAAFLICGAKMDIPKKELSTLLLLLIPFSPVMWPSQGVTSQKAVSPICDCVKSHSMWITCR